jgi:hypothetical protein
MPLLRDVCVTGTEAQIRGNLRKIGYDIQKLSGQIVQGPLNDYINFVWKRTLAFVAKQLIAASKAYPDDIDAFAWRTRNVLECLVLVGYVGRDVSIAKSFAAQIASDEKFLLEGFVKIAKESHDIRPLTDRIEHIHRVLGKHGHEDSKPFSLKQIAKGDLKDDVDSMKRTFDKYFHPTGWSILADSDQRDFYWEPMILNIQSYGLQLQQLGTTVLRLEI